MFCEMKKGCRQKSTAYHQGKKYAPANLFYNPFTFHFSSISLKCRPIVGWILVLVQKLVDAQKFHD